MSTTHHYKSDLRDIFFNLFEDLRIQETSLGRGQFASMDEETAREVLRAMDKLAREELATSFAESDRVPLKLDGDGNVSLPPGLLKSLKAFYRDGWERLDMPEHLGGFGASRSVQWAAFELQTGANPPLGFYLLGGYIARTIDSLGTESQKKRYVDPILDNHWGGTMVLTEPGAGSDVGAGRTKARHIDGDVWELEGVKRFITNADFDVPNIVHLVLARPENGRPGTKGLSMFIVPKYWVNEDGSLGERNGAFVTNVEKKMGIKGSCTCELTLGDRMPCRGLLVGNVHQGIRQMFQVIEYARMAVGVKSMATLSTAYRNALEFAKERVQGGDMAKMRDKAAPRVRIIEHPDVRRMLMNQKAHAEGMRAMAMYTAWVQDQKDLAHESGAEDAVALERRHDLLLPLVKGYNSDRAWAVLSDSLQTFGGSGYIQDYPIEQYIRDQKIDSLYEGTTHIQALDLFFRKIMRDGGETLRSLLGEAQADIEAGIGGDTTAGVRAALGRALGDLQALLMTTLGKTRESVYHVGLHGNRILLALSDVVVGWRLLRHAAVAADSLDSATARDKEFYLGKIAAARYFAHEVLPGVTLAKKIIERSSLDLMELPEGAF